MTFDHEAHMKMWDWLAQNPKADKEDWLLINPHEELGDYYYCYACLAAKEPQTYGIVDCSLCPIDWEWNGEPTCHTVRCLFPGSRFRDWTAAKLEYNKTATQKRNRGPYIWGIPNFSEPVGHDRHGPEALELVWQARRVRDAKLR